jgi:DUF917 family protein
MKGPVDPKSLTEGQTVSYVEREGDFVMIVRGTIKSVQHFSGDETEVVFTNGFTMSFFPGDSLFVSDDVVEPDDNV